MIFLVFCAHKKSYYASSLNKMKTEQKDIPKIWHHLDCHLPFSTEDAQLTPLLRLGAGACAGIIAMSATYPMDMVRGRITVQVFYEFFEEILPVLMLCIPCNDYGAVCCYTFLENPLSCFADREVSLSVQRNGPCSIHHTP